MTIIVDFVLKPLLPAPVRLVLVLWMTAFC